MSPDHIPNSYLIKSNSRLKALKVLLDDKAYSDVVREAQEIVELCSKGLLRIAKIDPPHQHDVGAELLAVKMKFSKNTPEDVELLAVANSWLRREREMSFYGAEDFDPVRGYSLDDADRAFGYAELARKMLAKELGAKPSVGQA